MRFLLTWNENKQHNHSLILTPCWQDKEFSGQVLSASPMLEQFAKVPVKGALEVLSSYGNCKQ